ncbi:MAG: ribonuclease 3 [Candidatus Binatia bacterium]|nr:MAG: ribonuclease 3 [Candidatus Binatia bacterium]
MVHAPSPLEKKIGYVFRDPGLLEAALTHASSVSEPGPRRMEQLEFLGDAVLGLMLGDLLLHHYPKASEGQLSQYRAALANTEILARKARSLGLHTAIRLGRGEEKSGGREKARILAASYEAVLGAIYLDGGCEAARRCVAEHFAPDLERIPSRVEFDAKTALQELCQARFGLTPAYRLVEQSGPDHARSFVVDALLGDRTLSRGRGRSKRAAERDAARQALQLLSQTHGND